MSLVNEMLNDLQKDQQKPVYIQGMVAADQKPTRSKYLGFIFLILIAAILIGYKLIYSEVVLTEQEQNVSLTQAIQPAKPDPQNTVKNIADTPTKPVFSDEKLEEKQIESLVRKAETKQINSENSLLKTSPEPEEVQTDPKETVSLESNLETTPVKTISRRTQAQKSFSSIVNDWGQTNTSSDFAKLDGVLESYSDIPSIWLSALSFLSDDYPSLYNTLLEKALVKKPTYDPFLLLSARDHFSSGNYILADQQLNKTNKINWEKNNYRLAGLVAHKLGNHQQAIDHYKRILVASPNRGDINMAIGISYEALKNSRLAVAHFNLALNDSNLSQVQKQFIKQRLVANQG